MPLLFPELRADTPGDGTAAACSGALVEAVGALPVFDAPVPLGAAEIFCWLELCFVPWLGLADIIEDCRQSQSSVL